MLTDLVVIGGLMGTVVGLLEVSHRLEERSSARLSTETALREAMRGPDGSALRAEFRRRGVAAPVHRRPTDGFGV
jgi:hypothetical protein